MVERKMGWAAGLWIALGCCFALARPASAYFHLMQIEQIIAGVGGENTAQAIQLRMRSALMGDVQNARLVVRDAEGANPIVVCDMSSPVANQFAGRRILIASDAFLNFTSPAPAVRDFAMTALIPPSYFISGSLSYESDGGVVQWRVCWGNQFYCGPTDLSLANDPDGSCAPPEDASLPHTTNTALRFINAASAPSTNSSADYALTTEAAMVINNSSAGFVVVSSDIAQACCKPDGTCEDLSAVSCESLGGRPQGPGTRCADTQCPPPTEACCNSDGNCEDLPAASCESLGGRPQGPGTRCAGTQCPPPTGACCLPNGSCLDGGRVIDCLASEGTFYLYQECADINCLRGCCLPSGGCLNLSAADCEALGGTALGLGVECCGVFCPELFPCCLADGTCTMVSTFECRNVLFGLPVLKGASSCLEAVCLPNVACCFPDGLCTDYLDAEDCILDGGVPTSGFCEVADCPDPTFACCLPSGCMNLTADECISQGGVPVETVCEQLMCPPVVACCYPDGTCETRFEDGTCEQLGGVPGGLGSSCASTSCPDRRRACCLPSGSCEFVTLGECSALQGMPQAPGTVCEFGLCPQRQEACCGADGECFEAEPQDCLDMGGEPQGVGSTCFGERGPGELECPPVGACCLPDGSCEDTTESGCIFFGGIFQGESSSCFDFEGCELPGACCLPDGTCFFTIDSICADFGGIFQGEGVSCAGPGDVCPPTRGACCLPGGACIVVDRESDCVAQSGTFQGVGSGCSPNPCPDAPAGACCFSDGSCMNLPERDCDAQGGSWHGDFSFCPSARSGSDDDRSGTPVTCPQPTVSCCFPSGECADLSVAECIQSNGVPGVPGSECCSTACGQEILVRCCFPEGGCSNVRPSVCIFQGGLPGPLGSVCLIESCEIFVCCFDDGACKLRFPQDCILAGGIPAGDCADCIGKKVQPLSGDYDGDDTVGLGDLGVIIQGWGSPYGLTDLGAVIQHWGLVRPPVQP